MGGKGASSERTTPVTWQQTYTPWQRRVASAITGPLIQRFNSPGLSPAQRSGQMARMMDSLNFEGANQAQGIRQAQSQGLRGGVAQEALQGMKAGRMQGVAQGVRSIEDMDMGLRQQNTANALAFLGQNAPISSESEGKSGQGLFSFGAK